LKNCYLINFVMAVMNWDLREREEFKNPNPKTA
jgi:hypothetical protein